MSYTVARQAIMQILVLGMHRSGTSVVTRLLNMMGAYFGPEQSSTGASAENPKGFWERRDVRQLNDALLASAGADWHRVSRFAASQVPAAAREDFELQARPLVRELDAHRPWVLKEPRFCVLFPLWRRLLDVPVCVLVHRQPLQVARSLQRRNGFPLTFGIALWERYVLDSLSGSLGLPRLLFASDQVMADPVGTVARLAHDLGELGVSGLRLPDEREILAFVEPRLYHHEDEQPLQDGMLTAGQKRLAEALGSGAVLDWDTVPEPSPGGKDCLAAYEQTLDLETTLAAERDARRQEVRSLARQVEILEDSRRRFMERDREARARLSARDEDLARERASTRHLAAELAQARERQAELRHELEESSRMQQLLRAKSAKLERANRDLFSSRSYKIASALSRLYGLLTLRPWRTKRAARGSADAVAEGQRPGAPTAEGQA